MRLSRREFVGAAASSLTSPIGGLQKLEIRRIKAIAFDAFPIFDPRPVFGLVNEIYPEKGQELSATWRTKQFEYTWLRTASHRYADFWQVTSEALTYAANATGVELSQANRDRLMGTYLSLKAWPEVGKVLIDLKQAGYGLSVLSNFSPAMLEGCVRSAGLADLFEHLLSTDRVRTYKPDPLAYRLGTDVFKLRREEILFVAYAGWDAAGAKDFGYPTYWVNRLNLPAEELGVHADATGRDLSGLREFLGAMR